MLNTSILLILSVTDGLFLGYPILKKSYPMRISTSTLHEELRLQELYNHHIIDTPAEQEFDELVELTAHILGCPIASITFIDETRQWMKASKGLELNFTDRKDSFCTHTIEQNEVMIVEDATGDVRFKQNPYVEGEPGVRFYAGAPIVSGNGYNLGTICVVDKTPRKLDEQQVRLLQIISRQVSKLLELRLKNIHLEAAATSAIQNHQDMVHTTLMRREKENFDLSTALHEELAQGLAATKLYLEMAEGKNAQAFIAKSKENVVKMLDDARSLSKKLFPTTLKYGSISDMLQQQLTQFELQTGICATLICNHEAKVHPDLHIILFRILKEGLKNIKAHAGALQVTVRLTINKQLQFTISDDGKGFDPQGFKAGFGLKTVSSFAAYYGGRVEITGRVDGGCNLHVHMPFTEPKKEHVAAKATQFKKPNFAMPEVITHLHG